MSEVDDKDVIAFGKNLQNVLLDLSKKHSSKTLHTDLIKPITEMNRIFKFYEKVLKK